MWNIQEILLVLDKSLAYQLQYLCNIRRGWGKGSGKGCFVYRVQRWFISFLIRRKTPQLMFWVFSLSHLSAKKCGFFLSYCANQFPLHGSGNCTVVAKVSLVSMKKLFYFLLGGIATNLKSGWTAQMCSKLTNEIFLHIMSDFYCVYSLGIFRSDYILWQFQ